jgi:hypothetical protein
MKWCTGEKRLVGIYLGGLLDDLGFCVNSQKQKCEFGCNSEGNACAKEGEGQGGYAPIKGTMYQTTTTNLRGITTIPTTTTEENKTYFIKCEYNNNENEGEIRAYGDSPNGQRTLEKSIDYPYYKSCYNPGTGKSSVVWVFLCKKIINDNPVYFKQGYPEFEIKKEDLEDTMLTGWFVKFFQGPYNVAQYLNQYKQDVSESEYNNAQLFPVADSKEQCGDNQICYRIYPGTKDGTKTKPNIIPRCEDKEVFIPGKPLGTTSNQALALTTKKDGNVYSFIVNEAKTSSCVSDPKKIKGVIINGAYTDQEATCPTNKYCVGKSSPAYSNFYTFKDNPVEANGKKYYIESFTEVKAAYCDTTMSLQLTIPTTRLT